MLGLVAAVMAMVSPSQPSPAVIQMMCISAIGLVGCMRGCNASYAPAVRAPFLKVRLLLFAAEAAEEAASQHRPRRRKRIVAFGAVALRTTGQPILVQGARFLELRLELGAVR